MSKREFFHKLRQIALAQERRVLAIEFEIDSKGELTLVVRLYP